LRQFVVHKYANDVKLPHYDRVDFKQLQNGRIELECFDILRSPLDRLHLCWTPTDSFVNMGAWQRLTDGAWIIKLWNICG
jgi:hypothetical protein